MVDEKEVMLTEFKDLRERMKNHFDRQLKLFSIIISALGVIYGIIFAYAAARDLILLIPAIILPLGLRFQSESYGIEIIGEYLETLEAKMKEVISCNRWEGYQTYWNKNHSELKMLTYDVGSKWLLFIAVPMSVSILYSYVVLFNIANMSKLPSELNFIHWISILFYGFLIVSTFGYFILYKKIYKEEIYKEILNKILGNK